MEEMQIEMIPIDEIKPNPMNPREGFDEEEIENLAESVEGSELMNPISVRKVDSEYEVIAGDRRLYAFKELGMDEVPSIVREADDFEAELMSAIENWHREGLDQEKQIYNLWIAGKARGEWGNPTEMSRKTGINDDSIRNIIEKYEMEIRSIEKEEISSLDAHRTRALKAKPKLREQVLKKRIDKEIKATDLPEFSKLVKKADEETREWLLQPDREVDLETASEYTTVAQKVPEHIEKRMLKTKRITPAVAEEVVKLPENIQEDVMNQIESRRLEEEEAISEIRKMKAEVEMTPETEKEIEATEEMRERYEELKQDIDEILERSEVQERGRWFRNWHAHYVMAGVLDNAFCPDHPDDSGELVWDCCGTPLKKAKDEAGDEFESRQEED